MKKLITKFWGIGLIVVLLSSLFIAAAPVSAADPLNWEYKTDQPTGGFSVLAPGTNIVDYAIGNDGLTCYLVTGAAVLQSTNGGAWWTDITASKFAGAGLGSYDFVAMAPDDPNIVVVMDSQGGAGAIAGAVTNNGGVSFSSLGTIQDIAFGDVPANIYGVEISPMVTGGVRYIAVPGTDAAAATGNGAALYYYNFGAAVGAWRDAMVEFGAAYDAADTPDTANESMDSIRAFAFSPNFPSDYMALAISEDVYATADDTVGTLRLHLLSFNSWRWDANVSTGYPVNVDVGAAATTYDVNAASIAMLPEYDGADEALRVVFAGAAITDDGAEAGGVWRLRDSAANPPQILGTAAAAVDVASVAFDGTNLAAGDWDSNTVWRSADPLSNNPTFMSARTLKTIGIDDQAGADINDAVQVMFQGDILYGAKIGDASALSKSTDYGNTWNDFSYMDSGNFGPGVAFGAVTGNITDIYVTATGDPWYIAANDVAEVSVYRMSAGSVSRVLCVPVDTADNLSLRGIPTEPDLIYAFDVAGTAIYYSADGGTQRWYKRVAPAAVADLAVESASVIYVADDGAVTVRKSVNAGFTWAGPVSTGMNAGTNNDIHSVAENQLVVGSTAGRVARSTDGGTTWSGGTSPTGAAGAIQIAASGLGDGDYIFAMEEDDDDVFRLELGPGNPAGTWRNMVATDANVNRGIVYTEGVLYVLDSAEGGNELINSTTWATASAVIWRTQPNTQNLRVNQRLEALETSSSGDTITLYCVSSVANWVYYFDDTLALAGISLVAPADGYQVGVNSINGNVQNVTFTWNRQSLANNYWLSIALDTLFTQQIANSPFITGNTTGTSPSIIVNGANNFIPGQTYYWRVQGVGPITSGASETRSFTVQPTGAAVPEIGAPENGGVVASTTPAFSWTPVSMATMYRFQLSEGTAFLAPLIDETLSGTGIKPNMELVPGRTYFWRVKAIAPVEGDWSSVANFMVAEPEPEPAPPVVVETVPAPQITVETPAPPPDIVIEPTPPPEEIAPAYIWAIIIIGAILVIAVIILIVRTRRSV